MITLDISDSIAVQDMVSDAQIRSFVNDGYLVASDLITSDEVEEIRNEVVSIARGNYPCEGLESLPENATDAELTQHILCIHQPHRVSPVILKYVRHPKVAGALSQLVGAHLAHWDGSVKCIQSMLFVKAPGLPGQAWHQDEIYIPSRDRTLTGAWIALDDATEENGCLRVIPSSHRNGMLYPQRQHNNHEEFDRNVESHGFDVSGEELVAVKSGDVVFFNGYLLHRSKKNRSTTYRRALVNHYLNAWSLLPWSLRDGECPANADRRAIELVAGTDPYLWKGIEKPQDGVHLRPYVRET